MEDVMELFFVLVIIGAAAAYVLHSFKKKGSKDGGGCNCSTCATATQCKERLRNL